MLHRMTIVSISFLTDKNLSALPGVAGVINGCLRSVCHHAWGQGSSRYPCRHIGEPGHPLFSRLEVLLAWEFSFFPGFSRRCVPSWHVLKNRQRPAAFMHSAHRSSFPACANPPRPRDQKAHRHASPPHESGCVLQGRHPGAYSGHPPGTADHDLERFLRQFCIFNF